MNHDVGTVFEGSHQVGAWHRVVDNQREAVTVGNLGDFLDVEHIDFRVGN